ncbi:hypothetical protein TTRE_0000763001 [Trichuris trichiura]|uniref:F-box domain-containing protein n=1 Tax=Trichuris trichiura TaxID=36087 RepID=A0A077ZI93_TRITR|nr:hypothetical protein TTRE_0000763001 [Trichuris trichiura]
MCDGSKNASIVVVSKVENEEQTSDTELSGQPQSEIGWISIDESTGKCSTSEAWSAGRTPSLTDVPVLPLSIIIDSLSLKDRMSLALTCKKFWSSFGQYPVSKEYVNVRSELCKLFPSDMTESVFRSSHSLSPWVKRLFRLSNPAVIQCIGFGRDIKQPKRICLTYLDSADLEQWFQLLPTSRIIGLEMDHCILDYNNVKLISDRCRNLEYFRFSEGCVSKDLIQKIRSSVAKVLQQFPSDEKKLGCKVTTNVELSERLLEFVKCLTYYMPNLTRIHFME